MARLSLALLGPLRLTLDDRPLTAFESDKVRALLIYLALEAERPQRRAMLAEMFWPEQPDRVGRHNLSQALFNLRQAIGDQTAQPSFLLITRDTVQFNSASDHSVDAATFSTLIAACSAHRHRRLQNCAMCADRLTTALDLYRGDFLAQFSLADSTSFEEWSLLKREQFGQAVFEALTTLATYYEARGDYGQARALAQRQLTLDPWREIAYRQLMRVLALDGQRTAALAAYERCRQVLADQLGVEPEAETTALYEQLRVAESDMPPAGLSLPLPGSGRHNLPAQLTPFVGRESELVQLGDLLANPQCRLITIHGPGGVGKTRLGLQAALEQLEVFPDGVCFVPLAQLHEPELLPTAIVDALGLTLHGTDEPSTQLLHFLRPKELLLLLDNFEHLLVAAQSLSHLLRSAPGVTLLVTSRERLDLQGEWLVEIGGLAVPDEHGTALERSSAGQLWVQTVRRLQAGYTLANDDRACIARICRMVEGMPLAIELAAAWVRMLACREIAEELAHGLALLKTASRDVPERHRSLRAVLDHSWHLLNDDEQRILRQLSVFRGGLERDAAVQVVGAPIALLVALVDKSLVRSSAHPANQRRYDLHELVRQYAFERLEIAGQTEQTRNHHLRYFVALAEQAALHFTGAEEGRWMLRLEAEHANLRAALEWALHQCDANSAARICGALWRFWHTRGYIAEGRQWIATVLSMADESDSTGAGVRPVAMLDKTVRAQALKGAGVLAWSQSDYAEARSAFETSLALYEELADHDGIAAVSSNLGVLAMYQGDYEQASVLLQTSLALRRQHADRWGTAACLHNLGAMAGKKGDLPLAQTYYEEALVLFRELGHERGIAVLLTNLGDVAEIQGHVERALRFSTESLAIRRKLGDTAGTATALTRLASLALRRNDVAQARSYYTESLTLFLTLGDKEYIAICLEGFSAVAAAQQQWVRATRLWSAAVALRTTISVPLPPSMRAEYEPTRSTIRAHVKEEEFADTWAEGQALSVEQAMEYALNA